SRVPKRCQTLGIQKNQRHALCPLKLSRTAVALCRASTPCCRKRSKGVDGTSLAMAEIVSKSGGLENGRDLPELSVSLDSAITLQSIRELL
ncbi:hypothetical protein, partial [Rhodopseudomonas palustris]|uniref:hypothetical protein n=1 Tax=Rhodopseudomonas palustris TaxID=1076 RepID=UPI001AED06A7